MGSLITVSWNRQQQLYVSDTNELALDDELCIYAIADFATRMNVAFPLCEIRQKVDITRYDAIHLDELANRHSNQYNVPS